MAQHISLGDIMIQQVVEQQGPLFDSSEFFPDLTPDLYEKNQHWLEPVYFEAGTRRLILCVQSYIVRTKHHNILIDTCVGNHKPRPNRAMWDQMDSPDYEKNLKAAGLTFEDIDYVMCTHLHTDHIGWNTRLENGEWVPTFPNAKYLFADREMAFWQEKAAASPENFPWIMDSVLPIVHAGQAEMVQSDHALNDNMTLIPTPGHTIDHYSVFVRNNDESALITGDMVHSPLQARYPELGMMSDYDSKLAGRTRRQIFGQFCDTSTLICTAHFPSPSTGYITRWGDGFRIA